jgi:hypothetical protein
VSLVSFIINYYDLYSEPLPFSTTGTAYNQQAHILITDRVKVSNILFSPIYNNNALKNIIVAATEVLITLGTKTVITFINSKNIIIINNFKIIVIRINIVFSFLFCID